MDTSEEISAKAETDTAMEIETVRRFNRLVTERIGALNDEYLARSRPLGSSRVLWEIGDGGEPGLVDVGLLRSSLGLDSGYLSRLLRALEGEGLIAVAPSKADSRARTARLTDKGKRERAILDTASDELAASLLAPLDNRQRQQLVAAAATVERLLTVGLIEIEVEDPTSADARFCIGRYFDELDTRFDSGFDPSATISAEAEELTEPAGLLLVARLRRQPIGCGALKFHHDEPAEIKRMWISPSARGLGLGRRLLAALEDQAASRGVECVRLETNRALTEAISLYRSAGYREVAAFNDEPFAHHWFEKELGSTDG